MCIQIRNFMGAPAPGAPMLPMPLNYLQDFVGFGNPCKWHRLDIHASPELKDQGCGYVEARLIHTEGCVVRKL